MDDLKNVYIQEYGSGHCDMEVDGIVVAFTQSPDGVPEMVQDWLDENDLTDSDIIVKCSGRELYYED